MSNEKSEAPLSGKIPFAVGQASLVRIPVPGTQGLAVEFRPRGHTPAGGSTSTLFIQDATGKRHLRLDYGYNVQTKTVDYHWNQKSTYQKFGIADHTPAGRSGPAAHHAARHFRYFGRILVVAAVTADVYSVVVADKPLRRASEVVTAWASAWVGCKAVGAVGGAVGTIASPVGTAIGGVGGCVIGGIAGYVGGATVGGGVYEWAEDTFFRPVPEIKSP